MLEQKEVNNIGENVLVLQKNRFNNKRETPIQTALNIIIDRIENPAERLIEILPKTGIIFLFHQVCKLIRLLDHPHNVMHI